MLKEAFDKDGYKYVCLRKNKQNYIKRVHVLVAQSFIPNPDNKPVVNHLDEIKDHNNVENLEWSTLSHNVKYGTGRRKALDTKQERKSGNYEKGIIAINELTGESTTYPSIMETSRQTGVNAGNIWSVCQGRWNHSCGYVFKYLKTA